MVEILLRHSGPILSMVHLNVSMCMSTCSFGGHRDV